MPTSSLLFLLFLFLVAVAVVFFQLFWPSIRKRRILRQAFPDHWLVILREKMPFYDRMPVELQGQLQDHIKFFLEDKNFIGCDGLQIDDEIRVTVAAQACLLLLNRPSRLYSDLRSILIYPSTFVVTRETRHEGGLVSLHQTANLGESWSDGKVVLAWDSVAKGVRDFSDGHNVVLHEFAHQLDHESGTTNGAPLLYSRGAYSSWSQVFSDEFHSLQKSQTQNGKSIIDYYGATNPAEFFAVATETFFERPLALKKDHSELFDELKKYYHLDPSSWM